ncbi:MAG: sulfur carrier protein ThiS [Proteobacteria bacterium]|nr:sulfur carrier protein ThiS [Pseudomonadota bacterium]
MRIYLNEKEYVFDETNLTINDLLKKLNMSCMGVVAEVDGDVFNSKNFSNATIKDGSKIELIRIVGGG